MLLDTRLLEVGSADHKAGEERRHHDQLADAPEQIIDANVRNDQKHIHNTTVLKVKKHKRNQVRTKSTIEKNLSEMKKCNCLD